MEDAIQTALVEHTGNGLEQAVELLLEARSDIERSGEGLFTPMGSDRGLSWRARSRLPSSNTRAMASGRRWICCWRRGPTSSGRARARVRRWVSIEATVLPAIVLLLEGGQQASRRARRPRREHRAGGRRAMSEGESDRACAQRSLQKTAPAPFCPDGPESRTIENQKIAATGQR